MINIKNKKLYRSPRDGIVLGIASGIGHFLEIDPVFVRLVWLALAIVTNLWPAILLYGVLFFLVPIDPAQDTVPAHQEPKDVTPEPSKPVEHMDGGQNM
jgi:phage shock protein PspC (stress-responsive transcriptional regulator)